MHLAGDGIVDQKLGGPDPAREAVGPADSGSDVDEGGQRLSRVNAILALAGVVIVP